MDEEYGLARFGGWLEHRFRFLLDRQVGMARVSIQNLLKSKQNEQQKSSQIILKTKEFTYRV